MSNLLKIITINKCFLNYINYNIIKINVIIILICLVTGCKGSEKADKARLDMAHKTVSQIPPTASDSEFLTLQTSPNPPPNYPWSKE